MSAGAGLDPTSVEMDGFFPHASARVWRGLTDPDVVSRWLMPSTGFRASVGTHFVFSLPTEAMGEIACEVLFSVPDEQLTLTWVDLRAERPARWVLDWRLRSEGRGTRVLLSMSGFDIDDRKQKMARNALERGWRTGLKRLGAAIDQMGS